MDAVHVIGSAARLGLGPRPGSLAPPLAPLSPLPRQGPARSAEGCPMIPEPRLPSPEPAAWGVCEVLLVADRAGAATHRCFGAWRSRR
jgi:hypothetical protein